MSPLSFPRRGSAPAWAAKNRASAASSSCCWKALPILDPYHSQVSAMPVGERDRGRAARRRYSTGLAAWCSRSSRRNPSASSRVATAGKRRWRMRWRAWRRRRSELVAVHDAVRPFIDAEIVEKVIAEAARTGAAIVGIVPVDTVKQMHKKDKIKSTLPREHLVLAQTPQVFQLDLLKQAFASARADQVHRHRRSQSGRAARNGRRQRRAGQRPQHQDHEADGYGARTSVP